MKQIERHVRPNQSVSVHGITASLVDYAAIREDPPYLATIMILIRIILLLLMMIMNNNSDNDNDNDNYIPNIATSYNSIKLYTYRSGRILGPCAPPCLYCLHCFDIVCIFIVPIQTLYILLFYISIVLIQMFYVCFIVCLHCFNARFICFSLLFISFYSGRIPGRCAPTCSSSAARTWQS